MSLKPAVTFFCLFLSDANVDRSSHTWHPSELNTKNYGAPPLMLKVRETGSVRPCTLSAPFGAFLGQMRNPGNCENGHSYVVNQHGPEGKREQSSLKCRTNPSMSFF